MVSAAVTVRVTGQAAVGTETSCACDGLKAQTCWVWYLILSSRQCWEVGKGRVRSVLGSPKAQIQDATFLWKVSPDVQGHSPSACSCYLYYALSAPIVCHITLAPKTECHPFCVTSPWHPRLSAMSIFSPSGCCSQFAVESSEALQFSPYEAFYSSLLPSSPANSMVFSCFPVTS